MLTALIITGLIVYVIHLSSRITKLEVSLEKKDVSAQSIVKPVPPVSSDIPDQFDGKQIITNKQSRFVNPEMDTSFDPKGFINALPKIGIVALIVGLAFFLKYAIDQGWISIYLRLALGGVVGSLMLVLYYLWREKYSKYALVLAGGGLAIWYLTTFAAVHMYSLMDINTGMVILSLVTVIGLLLAYYTKSAVLAVMAWGGAFIAPIVLGLGSSSYIALLIYLTVVSLAMLISIYYHKNKSLFALAILGSGFNLLWVSLTADVAIYTYSLQTLLFLLIHLLANSFVVSALIMRDQNDVTPTDQKEYSLVQFVAYIVFGIPAAIVAYNHFRDYASLILLGLGVWTFLIYSLNDRLEFEKLNLLLSGLGTAAISMAVFWQFNGNSQIVMLYVVGLVGMIIGMVQKRFEIRSWALAVVMLGIVTATITRYHDTSLFISDKFGLEVLGIIALVISYFLYREDQLSEFEKNVHKTLQYVIAALLWFFVSWDLINHFNGAEMVNQRNLSISLWWIILSVGLFAGSVIESLRALRKPALILLGLVIIKVFLYDVQNLDTLYRIISFITLGVILLVVSFAYQHNKEKIKQLLE